MKDDYPKPIPAPDVVQQIATAAGGTITECAVLPDGSGFALMSMPLRKDHWIYQKGADGVSQPPPMPFRMGVDEYVTVAIFPNKGFPDRSARMTRKEFAQRICEAGKHAVRGATMHGAEMDFDPDALLQNLIVGMLGYWTADGLSGDAWANPPHAQRPAADAVAGTDEE